MDKSTFDIIIKFHNLENELYMKLEKELGIDKAEDLVSDFTDYREQILKIGKYTDDDKALDTPGFLTEIYEDFQRYLKVTVIYQYENGYSLCETTSGLINLIPSKIISFERV